MEIGAYLFVVAVVWLVALLALHRIRPFMGAYTVYTWLLALACLILFYLLSAGAGLVRTGVPQQRNIPQDYIAHGVAGMLILLVGLAGVLAPLIVASFLTRRAGPPRLSKRA